MSHKHDDVGLQLDEDTALVASEIEDDTSQSSSSSSAGSEEEAISLRSNGSHIWNVNIECYIKMATHKYVKI